ncbi:MAG: OmpA family protein [Sterolibacterium sp.]|nr:OmpA family protein [Sterolibacterium sp.]
MKNHRLIPITLIAAAVLAGCSSLPASNSLLDQARSDYNTAQANPQVATLAAGELKQASESLDKANNALSKGEKSDTVDHLAYVAKQQTAIAQETAKQKAAELAVANANAERDKVRLAARTQEADVAQRSAEVSQREAEKSQRQAVAERQVANAALVDAQSARQQTQDAEARSRDLEAQLKDLQAKKTDRGMLITLGDVLFDTNHAQLKSGGLRNLQKLGDFLKRYPQRTVMIEGFTDSTGGNIRNMELSDQRAASVRTAMLDMGIASERITSRGYGESYPVADNKTSAGRQLNRRVEIIISDDGGKIAPR